MKTHPLHERAILLSKHYLKLENELIELLQQIEKEMIHLLLGYRSLFQYCVEALKLGENQAYTFIGVSRKCSEVPVLKTAIEEGRLNTSKAKKIISVIKQENSREWIEKAQALSQKELEREVASINPERMIQESLKQVTKTQSEFKTSVNLELEKKLNRCQEIIRQQSQSSSNWEKVLEVLTNSFLERHDPICKAAKVKINKPEKLQVLRPVNRIPTSMKHQVNQRDQGSCQYVLPNGKKCSQRYWVEIHHKLPVSEGGEHYLDNLITLCKTHHHKMHDFEWFNKRGFSK